MTVLASSWVIVRWTDHSLSLTGWGWLILLVLALLGGGSTVIRR